MTTAAALGEEGLRDVVDVFVVVVEAAGAGVVFLGAAVAIVRFLLSLPRGDRSARLLATRLDLGRYLLLGLELQLAGDVLQTAIAPTYDEIGHLAAIAGIRIVLGTVLMHEAKRQRKELVQGHEDQADEAAP